MWPARHRQKKRRAQRSAPSRWAAAGSHLSQPSCAAGCAAPWPRASSCWPRARSTATVWSAAAPAPPRLLLTRRARNASGTPTQCTRRNDSPPPPPSPSPAPSARSAAVSASILAAGSSSPPAARSSCFGSPSSASATPTPRAAASAPPKRPRATSSRCPTRATATHAVAPSPARPFPPSTFLDKNRRGIGKSQPIWNRSQDGHGRLTLGGQLCPHARRGWRSGARQGLLGGGIGGHVAARGGRSMQPPLPRRQLQPPAIQAAAAAWRRAPRCRELAVERTGHLRTRRGLQPTERRLGRQPGRERHRPPPPPPRRPAGGCWLRRAPPAVHAAASPGLPGRPLAGQRPQQPRQIALTQRGREQAGAPRALRPLPSMLATGRGAAPAYAAAAAATAASSY
jgi:hypothetical protein